MKQTKFLVLIWLFVTICLTIQAGTTTASLWVNTQGQKVILLGDQHYPSQENPQKEKWIEQERNQYITLVDALQTIDNSSGVALLIENLEKLEKCPKSSLLSWLSYSIYKNPALFKKITIHDLDEGKLRFKWMSAIKSTQKEIIETVGDNWIQTNVQDEDKCEYIIKDVFDPFFEATEPLIETYENSLNMYINQTENLRTKKILQALLANQTAIWNKIIDDYNTLNQEDTKSDDVQEEEDDDDENTALNNLLSLFLATSSTFYETNYYDKADRMSGMATMLDGLCECNALWHITKPAAAKTIIVIAGSGHTERLENYLDESNYKKMAFIEKTKNVSNNDYVLLDYKISIKKWMLLPIEQLNKQAPKKRKRKR